MRFTIERIRNLMLATAVLLVVAIAAFLAIAKFRHPFSGRDIPQRLGIDIQQEANGVTYTQAHGGHTTFKIHASKVVQLRNNRAMLHDVAIELYGKDGARVDRIQGAEFEYDQKSSIATADGPVEIVMQRPPQPGRKPNPSSDEIRVKTSGVTFNQQTGVVTTAQRVEFSTAQGSGSAMGASYDSDLGYMVLDHAVELTTTRGANPIALRAAHAELNRDSDMCTLREATAQTRGEQATATAARIFLRDDGSVERLEASDGFTLSTAQGSHLAAPTGLLEFSVSSQPRHAHLEGGVTIRSASAGRAIQETSPVMDLDFTTAGELRHAHLERGVEIESQEQRAEQGQSAVNGRPQPVSLPVEMTRTWRSPVADIDFRAAAPGQIEPAFLHGTGGVVITSEARRPGAAPIPSRLAADDLSADFGPHAALTSMTGQGHAALDETTATGARESATGDRLEAHFIAPASAPASLGAPSLPQARVGDHNSQPAAVNQLAQIQSAQLDGHVVLVDQPTAKPGDTSSPQPSPLRATAGRALYQTRGTSSAPEQWMHLTVHPHVNDGGLDLAADAIDLAQSTSDAFAHGNVKATWVSDNSSSSNPSSAGASQQAFALGGNSPAHVVAAEAQLHQPTGEATFRGHARLWQDQNSISAPVIVLNRQQQTLTAQAGSAAEPVVAVLLSAQAPSGPQQPAASPHPPSVIRVRGGNLRYSAVERKALFRAAPLTSVAAQTGAVETTSDQLELFLVPPGSPPSAGAPSLPSATAEVRNPGAPSLPTGAPTDRSSSVGWSQARVGDHGTQPASTGASAPSQIDRIVAQGHVVLNAQGRRGTGSQLVYTSQTGNYVLTGTPAAPPRMTDPQRGSVTGQSLIFNSRDDSVSIEGGAQQTTTQTTAPR